MFRRDQILKFVVRLLLVYGLLVIPWPGLVRGYGRVFCRVADAVLGSSGQVIVQFRPIKSPADEKDVEIAVKKNGSRMVYTTPITTRLAGYLPTATVVALVLATAIPWRRKWKALLWALLGVHLFIWIKMAIGVFYSKSVARLTPFFEFDEFWTNATFRFYEMIGRQPTISYTVPVIIWILVTLRWSDFELTDLTRPPFKTANPAATPRRPANP